MADAQPSSDAKDLARQNAARPTPLTLLERVRANEPAAWRRLIDLYTPLVRSWCVRAGLDNQDTEDVQQEVFAAVARALVDFRRDRPGDTFRGWLRVITRNQILLHHRRRKRWPEGEGGSENWQSLQELPDPLASEAEDAVELSQLYRRALEQVRCHFEERTWQAFWLTAIEGRAPAALASQLGMSAASIRQAKCRVMQHLRRELGDLLVDIDQV